MEEFPITTPTIRTKKAIMEPIKRIIPKSPAFIKILYSIINPNKVATVDIFLVMKFSSSEDLIVSFIQKMTHEDIPITESIKIGSDNKPILQI